jgi:hypothetical protein
MSGAIRFDVSLKKAKEGFFDRAAVLNAVDKATLQVMSKFGAYVRRSARRSIYKRPRVSRPGKPPSSHLGILRDKVFFSWDASRRSLIVGPVLAGSRTGAPEILEYGGEAEIVKREKGGTKTARVQIAARPYMAPALAKEEPKLPGMWRDSIK